jgi:hypothetical protein
MTAADSLLADGTPQLPASLLIGEVEVPSLTVIVTHPGGPATGPIRCDSLAIQPRNELGQPLVPSVFIDRIEAYWQGASVGLVTNVPSSGSEVIVPLSAPSLGPGMTDSLEIRFDVEVTAPTGAFQMAVVADGIYAYDDNVGTRVDVAPAGAAVFPLTSGLTELESPARELAAGFEDTMPAVLSAGGATIRFASLTLRNTADPNSGDIRLDRLELKAADRDLVPIDLGSAVSRIEAFVDDVLWADSGNLDPAATTATVVAAELTLSPGVVKAIELRATLREGSSADGLRLGLEASGVGVVQPTSSVLSISVLAEEEQSFPFWTQSGNFTGASLSESWANFPNPFAAGREATTFAFNLPQPGRVSLEIWSVRGKRVLTVLEDLPLGAGLHQNETWDGRNGRGDVVVNGVYLAEIRVAFDDGSSERHLRKVAVVR